MQTKFDKIYITSLITNHDRQEFIKYQMNDLGLEFEFIYGIDYYNIKYDKYNKKIEYPELIKNSIIKERDYGCTMTHYQAVLQAYELGYNNVLIIEDDICFLKDKETIEYYLNNIPLDGDFITWDPRFLDPVDKDIKYDEYNDKESFVNLLKNNNSDYIILSNNYNNICGGMMYAIMNRDSMELYLNNQRQCLKMSDHIKGFFENPIIKRYVSTKCLCIDQYNYERNFCSCYYSYDNIYKDVYNLNINNFYKPEIFTLFTRW